MNTDASPIVAAPVAPLDSPVAATAPTRLGAYLRGPGRFMGWAILLLVPLFILSIVILSEVVVDSCQLGVREGSNSFYDRYIYDHSCLDRAAITTGAVSFVFILAAAVSVASSFATWLRPMNRPAAPQSQIRLQGIKDWYIRGDIDETDYQRVKQIAESTDTPHGPGRVAANAAMFLQSFALVMIPLLVFWFIFTAVFVDEMVWFTSGYDEAYPILVNSIGGGLLGVGLVVFSSVRAANLRGFRTSFERDMTTRLERAEEELMRKARSHHGGGRSLASPVEEATSFTPYRGRRR